MTPNVVLVILTASGAREPAEFSVMAQLGVQIASPSQVPGRGPQPSTCNAVLPLNHPMLKGLRLGPKTASHNVEELLPALGGEVIGLTPAKNKALKNTIVGRRPLEQ